MRLSVILPLLIDFVALAFLDTDDYQATGAINVPTVVYSSSILAQQCTAEFSPGGDEADSHVSIALNGSDPTLPYGQRVGVAESQALRRFYPCMLALYDGIKQSVAQLREPEHILSSFNILKISTLRYHADWMEYSIRLVSARNSILQSYGGLSTHTSKCNRRTWFCHIFWEDCDSCSYLDFRQSLRHYEDIYDDLSEMNYQLHQITLLSEDELDTIFDALVTERSRLLKVKEQRLARIITFFFKRHRFPCPSVLFFNRVIQDVRNLKEVLVDSRLYLESTKAFVDELYSVSGEYLASSHTHSSKTRAIVALIQDWRLRSM